MKSWGGLSWRSLLVCAASVATCAHADIIPGQGTWASSLQGRDLDDNLGNGFEAYYDQELNVTWLADANFARTTGTDSYGDTSDGRMSWSGAQRWVQRLNVHGVEQWRLPTLVDVDADGCRSFSYAGGANVDCGYNVDPSLSELAHMFFVTLGNRAWFAPVTGTSSGGGSGLVNTGPFAHLASAGYWAGVEDQFLANAWYFYAGGGLQDTARKADELMVWPVRQGDVAQLLVPEPSGVALSLAGCFALLGWGVRCRTLDH